MRPHRALAAVLFAIAAAAHAQYTVGSVAYKGGAPFADAELSAVAGLQAGQMMATNGLGDAAQHLLDTGLFDDVQATYTQQGNALHITFQLKPLPPAKLLTVSLENFPWFTPEELTAALHQQLPLYHGFSSDAGTFSDSIQTALQQMLAAKDLSLPTMGQITLKITPKITHTIVEPTSSHPQRAVDFRVDFPLVVLANASYTGTYPPIDPAYLAAYLKHISGGSFNEGLTGNTVQDMLLKPWRDRGYAAAKLDDIHRTVTPCSTCTAIGGFAVSYSAHPDAGPIYTVKDLVWQSTAIYSQASFQHDTELHPGDIFSAQKLFDSERAAIAAYRHQGYLYAYIRTENTFDDPAKTMNISLSAEPGAQYRLKSVAARGLTPQAQQVFDTLWTMKPGDLYDTTYLDAFLSKNIQKGPLSSYGINFDAQPENETHTVDLIISFVPYLGPKR